MSWEIEYTDNFENWWQTLSGEQQDDLVSIVQLLQERGTQLPFPYSSGVNGSKHSHMRELRIQSGGNPIRVFYAFDPRRVAILLIRHLRKRKKPLSKPLSYKERGFKPPYPRREGG